VFLSEPVRKTIRELTSARDYQIGGQHISIEHIASEMTPDGLWMLSHTSINGLSRGKKIELVTIDPRTGDVRKRMSELDRPPAYSVPAWYFEEVEPLSQKVSTWRNEVLTRQRALTLKAEHKREQGFGVAV
jgi:hypothetical protein